MKSTTNYMDRCVWSSKFDDILSRISAAKAFHEPVVFEASHVYW